MNGLLVRLYRKFIPIKKNCYDHFWFDHTIQWGLDKPLWNRLEDIKEYRRRADEAWQIWRTID